MISVNNLLMELDTWLDLRSFDFKTETTSKPNAPTPTTGHIGGTKPLAMTSR